MRLWLSIIVSVTCGIVAVYHLEMLNIAVISNSILRTISRRLITATATFETQTAPKQLYTSSPLKVSILTLPLCILLGSPTFFLALSVPWP